MILLQMLAETAPTIKEGSGEGSWITTGFVAAIFAGIAGVLVAYRKGQAHGVEIKNQPIKVEGTPAPVPWQEVRDLKDRLNKVEQQTNERLSKVEARVDEIKAAQGKNFVTVLEAQHASELRVMEKIADCVTPIHARLDAILLALAEDKKKPKV